MPALYDTVTLKSSRNCRVTLEMLRKRRDICGFIRKLAVRPNYYLAWPKPDEQLSEAWVADMIEEISMDLKTMHTFDWDGLELPKDTLWTRLRLKYVSPRPLHIGACSPSGSCPQLKSVFSNVGTQPLDPFSALFEFTDLTSFSLIVRHGLGGSGKAETSFSLSFFDLCLRTFSRPRRNPSTVLGDAHHSMPEPPRTRDLQFLIIRSGV